MARRLVRAFVFVLCLVPTLGAIAQVAGEAHAQEGAARVVEERLLGVDEKNKLVQLEETGRIGFVSDDVASDTFKAVELGVMPVNKWVKATIVNNQIARMEPTSQPAPKFDKELEARIKRNREIVATFTKGDRIRVNGMEGVFDGVQKDVPGQVPSIFVKLPGRPNFLSLKEITSLEKIGPGPNGGQQPPTEEKKLFLGQPYRLKLKNGTELYGYFSLTLPADDKSAEFTFYDGTPPKFIFEDEIETVEVAEAPRTGPGPGNGGGPGPSVPAGPKLDVVVGEFTPTDLDYQENVWRLEREKGRAKVSHSIRDHLVVGARITVTYRGDGWMVPPAKEAEILQAMAPQIGAADTVTFEYLDVRHYYQRGPAAGTAIIAERNPGPDPVTRVITDAIFPDLSEPFSVETRLFNPRRLEEPTYTLDAAKNVIPYTDERAVPHLIRAYADGDPKHRVAALRAMPVSANPRLLPFLVFEFYQTAGNEADLLKRTIGFFRDKAEDYLVGLIKDGGWQRPLDIPTAAGGVEKKDPSSKEKLLAKVIELLEMLESDRANQYVLPLARSADALVRDAAHRFFIARPKTLGWVVLKLVGAHAAEAKILLREMDAAHPGSLGAFIGALKNVDPSFEQKLTGLSEDEVREKRIEYLVEYRQKNEDMGEGDIVRDTRIIVAEIERAELEGTTLRRELAAAYAAAAIQPGPQGGEERRRRMALLKRAVTLDAANETARRELATTYVDIAREMRQGAFMRSGPGEDYVIVRPLKRGEELAPEPLPDGQEPIPTWRYVRATDGVVGFVSSSVAQQGRTKLIVLRDHRPFADRRKFLLLARAFHPGRLTEIEEGLAELAAVEAADASQAGDWKTAYERYRTAESLAPGQYRFALAGAYIRGNPLVGVLALGSIALFIGAFVGGRKRLAAQPGRKKPPEPELSRENVVAKKVPS